MYTDILCIMHHYYSDKKQTKVYLIPETESRDHHTYHYTVVKTRKFILENTKLRMKKFNPVKRIQMVC